VHLAVAQQDLFLLAFDVQGQDGGVKGFLAQVQQNGVHVEVDRLGGFGATVDDGRNTASATQAAARSGALVIALLCSHFELHGYS